MATGTTLRVPTIHLNGDTRGTLMAQVCEAYSALGDAIKAVQGMAPNGRNYYPQGPDATRMAQLAHGTMVKQLVAIQAEIEAYGLAIQEA